ncbi:arsenate reductase (glutaredoxin) [Pararhizobium antarcticum]|uniref:Arsenate reductase n=1 Tax=Pararhizobium antarcticum TaxID=1798805 RepID=A0A657LNU6_9HYPH|nr:arsenate reductase (glutaredoxin) [Pararhizobium antarcticum]OJF93374.1 arsenate reductase [Pararhizobium antarcticum]OJF95990.1 arsenate reductase [Rhizobium sp. 58]
MAITIYHNRNCGTSRNVLKLIRDAGYEPTIIDYMESPPGREEMLALLIAMDMSPRALLRTQETLYTDLQLDDGALDDRALLDAMLANPRLIERPIVISEKGVRLCRPKEKVLELL